MYVALEAFVKSPLCCRSDIAHTRHTCSMTAMTYPTAARGTVHMKASARKNPVQATQKHMRPTMQKHVKRRASIAMPTILIAQIKPPTIVPMQILSRIDPSKRIGPIVAAASAASSSLSKY